MIHPAKCLARRFDVPTFLTPGSKIRITSPCFQGPSTPGNHMTWSVLKWLVLCFMHFMHIKKLQVFLFYTFYAHKENTSKYSHFQPKKNRQQRFWPLCVNYTSRVTSDPKRYIGSVSCPHCGGQTSTYGKNPCPYQFGNFENYLFKRQCPSIV